MKGTTFWEIDEVLEAVNVCLFNLFAEASSEERDELDREYLTVAIGHLERAKKQLLKAQALRTELLAADPARPATEKPAEIPGLRFGGSVGYPHGRHRDDFKPARPATGASE